MTIELVEGEVTEVGLTVVPESHVERLDETATPEGMVSLAARMATALADIVEKKNLYATIQGKKYPQVEAWMTIGRMDNVAAREVRGGITRVEGGGFEAEVELIRLSDGMTVGYGSAMCGTPGDNPWEKRPVHVQRSMAVTRATSRAFRQRYSWIMALAGYEPTPADEMPGAPEPVSVARNQRTGLVNGDPPVAGSLIGTLVTQGTQDFQLRESPDGWTLPFRVKEGSKSQIVMAHDDLAVSLAKIGEGALGQRVEVWGRYSDESIEKPGKPTIHYRVLHLERIQTADWMLPTLAEAPTVWYKVLHLERIQTADWMLPTLAEAPTAPLFAEEDLSELPF